MSEFHGFSIDFMGHMMAPRMHYSLFHVGLVLQLMA